MPKREPRETDYSHAWRRGPLHTIGKLDDEPRRPGRGFRGELWMSSDRALRVGDRAVRLIGPDLPDLIRKAEKRLARTPGATWHPPVLRVLAQASAEAKCEEAMDRRYGVW